MSRKGVPVLDGTEMVIEETADSGRRAQRPSTPAVLNSITN